MNAPVLLAQLAGSAAQTPSSPKNLKLEKPQNGQAVTVHLDGNTKLDFGDVASEKLTFVKVGEKLIILFDNQSTVTVDPVFDSLGRPLTDLAFDMGNDRTLNGEQFAQTFPITTDQSVLPAAGNAGGPTGGANFSNATVDALSTPNPLDLLGQEELPGIQFGVQDAGVNTQPTAGFNADIVLDEDGIPGANGNAGGPLDIDAPYTASGVLAHNFNANGPGTIDFAAMNGTSQVVNGVTVKFTWNAATNTLTGNDGVNDVFTLVLTDPVNGNFTVTLQHALLHHTVGDNVEGSNTFTLTYTVHDSDNEVVNGTVNLVINDDTPEAQASAPSDTSTPSGEGQEGTITLYAKLDDEGQANGNQDPSYDQQGDTAGHATSVSGKLNFSAGADGVGSVAFTNQAGNPALAIKDGNGNTVTQLQAIWVDGNGVAHIENVTLSWNAATGTLSGTSEHYPAGTPAFTLSVDSSGNYTFTANAPLAHPLTDDPATAGTTETSFEDNLNLSFTYTVTDGDGDKVSASLTITVNDDAPVAFDSAATSTVPPGEGGSEGGGEDQFVALVESGVVLDDEDQAGGNQGGPGDIGFGTAAYGTLNFSAGADGVKSVAFNPSVSIGGESTLHAIYVGADGVGISEAVTNLVWTANANGGGTLQGYTVGGHFDETPVFTLTVDAHGQFSFVLNASLDHPSHAAGDSSDTAYEDNLSLSFGYTVTDGDGDKASANLTINVNDDVPTVGFGGTEAAIVLDETIGVQTGEVGSGGIPAAALALFDALTTGSDPDVTHDHGAISFGTSNGALVNANVSFGADGAAANGALVYSLTLPAGTGEGGLVDSGLATTESQAIYLFAEGNLVVGRVGGSEGTIALAIAIDPVSGQVSVAQYLSFHHSDTGSANEIVSLAIGSVSVTVTATDGDGDVVSGSKDVSGQISFHDDGPTLTVAPHNDLSNSFFFDGFASNGDQWGTGSGINGTGTSGSWTIGAADQNSGSGAIQLERVGDGYLGMHTSTGGYMVDLDASARDVAVSQTLNLASGQHYTLTFEAGSPADGSKHLVVMFGGQVILDLSNDQIPTQMTTYTIELVGGSGNGSNLLVFEDTGIADNYGTFIANIAVRNIIIVDETAGVQADSSETTNPAVGALFSGVSDKGTDPNMSVQYAVGTKPALDISVNFGADGPATLNSTVYSLTIGNVNSGLYTTEGKAIQLFLENGIVVGRYDSDNNGSYDKAAIAFTISQTGVVSVAQYVSLKHPDTTSNDEGVSLAAGALKGTVTITDGDGDTATQSADISAAIRFEDDGPSLKGTALKITVDEDDILTNYSHGTSPNDGNADGSYTNSPSDNSAGPARVTGTLAGNVDFGADGAAATGAYSFTSGAVATLVALGLTSHGQPLSYVFVNGVLTAFVDTGAKDGLLGNGEHEVFTLKVDPVTGAYTFSLSDSIDHVSGNGQNSSLVSTNGISQIDFGAVLQATDGDGDKIGLTGQLIVTIRDDVPSVDARLNSDFGVTADETSGNQNDDVTGPLTVFANVADVGHDPDRAGAPLAYAQSSKSALNVTAIFGADGAATSNSIVYSLKLSSVGADSGLDVTDGHSIKLYMENGLIIGRVDGGTFDGKAAFAIAIDPSTGKVSVVEYLSIEHSNTNDSDDSAGIASGKISATVTIADGDGDTDSESVDISTKIRFEDDGPTVNVTATGESSILLTTQDADTIGSATDTAVSTANFGNVFSFTSSYGADGAGSIVKSFALDITKTPVNGRVDSGLDSNGNSIYLYEVNGAIVGSTSSSSNGVNSSNTIFKVSVDNDGKVTLTQYAEIDHAAPGQTQGPYDGQYAVLGTGLVSLTEKVTVTDGDGDKASSSASIDLGGNIRFADDGPTVSVTANDGNTVLLTTQDADTIGNDTDTSVSTANFGGVFTTTSNYGADGAGSIVKSFTLAITGAVQQGKVDSGLDSNGQNIYLYTVNGAIVGSTSNSSNSVNSGNTVFKVSVDSDGKVTLTQYAEIDHTAQGQTQGPYDGQYAILGNGLMSLSETVTITDGDGDKATSGATIDLGGNIRFADDGPRITGNAIRVTVDEDDIATSYAQGTSPNDGNTDGSYTNSPNDNSSGPARVFGTLAGHVDFGADGAASSNAYSFKAGAAATLAALGLTSHGQALSYVVSNGVLTAFVDTGAHDGVLGNGEHAVFTLTVDPITGAYTFSMFDSLDHVTANGQNTTLVSTSGISQIDFGAVLQATDGDGDSVGLTGQLIVTVRDDVPTVDVDTRRESDVILTTQDADTIGSNTDVAVSTANFGGVFSFTSSYGADGAGSTVKAFTLGITGQVQQGKVNSGLDSDGNSIYLYNVNGVIVGSTATSSASITTGNTIFQLSVDGDGKVTLTQYAEIDHAGPGQNQGPYDGQYAVLNNNLISLTETVTITDGDGDKASSSASIDLGGNIRFADDGPSVSVTANGEATVVLTTQDAETIGNNFDTATSSFNFGNVFSFTSSYGADGAGSIAKAFTLSVAGQGGDSGLDSHGQSIYLYVIAGEVVGSTSNLLSGVTGSNTVFKVSVDGNGAVTLTQYAEIDHAAPGESQGPYDDQYAVLGTGLISLTEKVTVTDGDGDKASSSASIDLGGNIRFADDGPTVQPAGVNLVTNGDFALGNWSAPQFWGSSAPQGSVPGWTLTGDPSDNPGTIQFERQAENFQGLHSSNGQGMIDLGASPGNYQLSQTFDAPGHTLTAGQQYTINFEAGAPFPQTALLQVYWGNTLIGVIDTTKSSGALDKYSFIVTASATDSDNKLTFREVGDGHAPLGGDIQDEGYHGTYIANVSVMAVNAVVDEDGLAHGVGDSAQIGDAATNLASVTGVLGVNWGADSYDVNDAGGVQDSIGRSLTFTNASVTVGGTSALTSNGATVLFQLVDNGTRLVGYVENGTANSGYGNGDRLVFEVKLSDDATGSFQFILHGNIDHAAGGNENDITLAFNYTATDFDGDTASSSFVVGIDDDMPVITANAENAIIDEGMLPSDAHPVAIAPFTGTVQAYGGQLNINWGADDGAAKHVAFAKNHDGQYVGPVLYSDGVKLVYSISTDAHGNEQIVAVKEGTSPSDSANWVFSVTLSDAGHGNYVFALYQHIDHPASGADASVLNFNVLAFDSDGDSVATNFTVSITDSTPVASLASTQVSVTIDETAGDQANDILGTANTPISSIFTNLGTPIEIAQSSGAVVSFTGTYGADGVGTPPAFGVTVSAAGVYSGVNATDGQKVFLYQEGGLVVGREGNGDTANPSGAVVFAISIDPSSGILTVVEYSALQHTDVTDPNESASPLTLAAGVVQATVTITDGDNDPSTGVTSITSQIKFLDDGPSVGAATDLIVNGSFESGLDGLSNGQWGLYHSITGWTATRVVDGKVVPFEIQYGSFDGFGAHEGGAKLELDSDLTGANSQFGAHTAPDGGTDHYNDSTHTNTIVQQGVTTVQDQTYVLTFWYSPRANEGNADSGSVDVLWNGAVVKSVDSSGMAPGFWYQISVVVTGTGAVGGDTLGFQGTGQENSLGAYIDSVSLIANAAAMVDEDGLTNGAHDSQSGDIAVSNGNGDTDNNEATANGKLGINWGADNFNGGTDTGGDGSAGFVQDNSGRSVTFTDSAIAVAGGTLTSHGDTIVLELSNDKTTLIGKATHDGVTRTVFEVSLSDDGTGAFRFILKDSLDQVSGGHENDMTLSFNFTATDSDGDTAKGSFTVLINDDVPVALADTDTATEGQTATGNVITGVDTTSALSGADKTGADGATVTQVTSSNTSNVATSSNGVLTIVGQYGTLTLNPDGSYSYAAKSNISNASPVTDTFTYTLTDGDGDTSSATLAIAISDGANPTVSGSASLTVNEAALDTAQGGQDILAGLVTGSSPSSTAETAQSTGLTFTAGSDNITGVTFGATAGISVSGATGSFTWVVNGSGQLEGHIGNSGGPVGIILSISGTTTAVAGGTASPTITATLTDNFPHAVGSGDVTISGVTVVATDTDGDTVAGDVSITVVDDVPHAVGDAKSLPEGGGATNVIFVIDTSGSVSGSTLAQEKTAAINLLNAGINGGLVLVVDFNSSSQNSGWVTVDAAKAYINGLTTGGSSTNYGAALQGVMTFVNANPAPSAAQTIGYFLSDGEPTAGSVNQNTWESFLTAKDIDFYGVKVGSNSADNDIAPIAYPNDPGHNIGIGNGTTLPAIPAVSVQSVTGNVLDNDGFGADGHGAAAGLVSIKVDTHTYSYDAATNKILRDGSAFVSGSTLAVDTTLGGKLTFYFAATGGHAAGEYNYTSPASVDANKTETFHYTIVDGDGDQSAADLVVTVTNVVHAPTALDLAAADDTGTTNSDNLTKQTSALTVTGSAENGTKVTLFDDTNNDGVQNNGEVTLATNVTVTGGTFTADITLSGQGVHHVRAIATDATNNVGPSSSPLDITIDTVAPVTVVTGFVNDSGVVGDHITNDNKLTITGTTEAFATVTVYRNGVPIGTTTADANGNWSEDDSATLSNGQTYQYTASATDAAGNVGATSANYAATIDRTAPSANVHISAIANDTGSSSTDFVTNDTVLTVSGTNGALGAGEKVQVSINGTTWFDVTQVTGTTWSYNDPVTHNANFTYQVRVIDVAANVGDTDSQTITIDTTAPTAAVAITAIANDTGTSGDFITNDKTLTVSGTHGPLGNGETVQISINGGTTWVNASSVGNTTWSYTDPATHNSNFTYQVRIVDTAGNVGQTDSQAITIDTTGPTVTSILMSDSALKIGDTSTVTITFSEAVAGFSNQDVTVENSALGTLTSADGGVTWTGTFTPSSNITDTSNIVTVASSYTDIAGNGGSGGTSLNYTVDTKAPTVVSIGMSDAALTVGETSTVTIKFSEAVTGFDSSDVAVQNGTLGALSSSDGGVTWTGTFTPAANVNDSSNVLTVASSVYTDIAGNAGSGGSSGNYTVNTVPVNQAPVITSGATGAEAENTPISNVVYQVVATDPEGTALTYSLSGTDAALFNISSTGAVTFKASPNFEAPTDAGGNNVYDIVVNASDGVNTTNKVVAISVTNVNEAPTITSGGTGTEAENTAISNVVYQAIATDPEGTALTYTLTGTDAALFNISATGAVTFKASPNFEAPADAGGDNVYDIVVNASDGTNVATKAVAITVTNVNEAPTITSGGTGTEAENTAISNVVYQVVATDPEGAALTYTLTGADAALFNISSTGAVTFKASPNFEAPTDVGGDNVYNIVVNASDGANTTNKAVAISVTNVNEAPTITSGGAGTEAENTAIANVVYQATATDPDAGTTLTYTLTGADAALFNISSTGAVTFKASPNFEAPADAGGDNVYDIVVNASDGTNVATKAVAITVTNVNEAPTITSGTTGTEAENTAISNVVYQATATDPEGAALTYTLTGADAALFNISSTGAVTFKASPNFEAPTDVGGNNVYDIVVNASDGTNVATKAVAITVTNVNEAPTITSGGTGTEAENTAIANVVYQATATDPDAGTTLTYTLTGADAALFNISSTGAVTFKASPNFEAPTDAGGNNVYDIVVNASDGTNVATKAVAITVTNVNEAPTITSGGTGTEAENTPISNVVYQVVATDPEGTALTYTLSGADAARFNISSTGAVTFKVSPDFEAPTDVGGNNVYDIVVNASDGVNATNKAVAITVTDVAENHAPVTVDDVVITNTGSTSFQISDWILMLNDTDADGNPLSITGVSNASSGTASHGVSSVTFTDTGNSGGSFDYTVSDGTASDTGHVTVTQDSGDMSGNFFVATNEIFIGNSSGTTINAYGGNDVLVGNGGDDTLNGGSGNDTYVFGLNDGDDTINETSGTDRILIATGGAALSSLNAYDDNSGTNAGDLVIQFNGQSVTINNQYDGDADLRVESISFDGGSVSGYDLGTGSYLINSLDPSNSGGQRVINLSASTSDNFIAGETGTADNITGGSGRDLIFGGGQNDVLNGGAGNDFLNGGAGNDTLNGGADNDTLVGGTGNDSLTGGSGADRFVFAETGSANRDTILDFSNAEGDVLDFSALLGAATGAAANGSNINDYVKLTQTGTNILVQVDLNGTAGGAQWADVATLQGYGTSAADIVKIAFQGQDHQLSV